MTPPRATLTTEQAIKRVKKMLAQRTTYANNINYGATARLDAAKDANALRYVLELAGIEP